MKTFRSVVTEAAKPKSRVILFGRMNPITKGHEENVQAAHDIAQKHGADLHVIASHSHDAKKNPLSAEQKVKHMKRAFGHLSNTELKTSSKEAPTILHHAAQAHAAGVKHLVIAGGGDRAAGYHKLLHDYNGVEGKAHGYYKFNKISIENTGERKEGVSGTDMRKHAASGNFDKFRAGLPSRIAKNEKHSQEMYQHVRSGMGVHEENRESYVAGQRLKLGEDVLDSFTGLQGRIVYRGPTYVTVQIDESLSFKRWIDDVDSLSEEDALPDIASFKEYQVPDDIANNLLGSLNYCPKAMAAFRPLLGNSEYDQGLVLEAIDATAHYLAIERRAAEIPGSVDDHGLTQFNEHLRHAAQILSTLGVLANHRSYMEQHAHDMQSLVQYNDDVAEARAHEIQGHQDIADEDLRSIEQHIDNLEWKDIEYLYKDQDHEEAEEESWEPDGNIIEGLTAAQRIKKRFEFMKTKSKREIAAQVARHRISTSGRLKKRSIVHARNLIMSRLLQGRSKSQLSAAEKDRVEKIVRNAKASVVRISNRLMPKLRQLEIQRMRHVREERREPNQATDLIYDGEEHGYETTMRHDTDTSGNETLTYVKAHLSGNTAPAKPAEGAKPRETIKRLKHFRKMED
jgi:nicotinamide mononucleotide adenylyltransferase